MCLMPPGAPRGAPPHKRGLRRACCTAVGDVLANNSPIFSDDLAVCARPCVARPDVHPPRNGSVASNAKKQQHPTKSKFTRSYAQ